MYRRHFFLFAAISVIFAIPAAALYGFALAWFSIAIQQTSGATDTRVLVGFLAAIGAGLVANLAILPFTNAAVIYAACESAIGRPVTARGVLLGVLRRYFPLLGYWLLFSTFTAYVALILCVAPFIAWVWVFVMWAVATPAMFVENIGLGAAVGRSRHLVAGRWWRTFLILFLAGVLYEVAGIGLGGFLQLAQALLQIVVSPFIASAIAITSGQLVGALITPIVQIVIVLIYFDLRVRREALDLFQMAHRLAAPPVAP
jgi:hypothetical protein